VFKDKFPMIQNKLYCMWKNIYRSEACVQAGGWATCDTSLR